MRVVVDAVTVLLAFDIGIDQKQASKDKSGKADNPKQANVGQWHDHNTRKYRCRCPT